MTGTGKVRDGAWVADITGLLDLAGWPPGCGSSSARNGPHPARSCGSPTSTGTGSPAFATARRRASSRTWSCGTGGGPVRGPDPLRQGHRAAEPAAGRLRAEPAVVRDRRAGLRAAGLDPDARPDRRRPLRNRNGSGCGCSRSPAAWPARPPPAAAARRALALGRRDHRRGRPLQAFRPADSRNNPRRPGKENTGARGTPPPARQPGSQATAST
jgi:hypothetical protein